MNGQTILRALRAELAFFRREAIYGDTPGNREAAFHVAKGYAGAVRLVHRMIMEARVPRKKPKKYHAIP